jgi:putative FmdB family regulatory protein
MPIMKYRCDGCGKEFAKIFFTVGAAPQNCPVCGAPEIAQLGAAFPEETGATKRPLCMTCEDGCEGGSCGTMASG